MDLSRTVRRLRRLSWADRLTLAEAVGALALVSAALRCLPFRWVAASFGKPMVESSTCDTPDTEAASRRVGWAVGAASRRMTWCRCLAQAIAAQWMMRRRRLSSTLYFGVAIEEDGELGAHAWLRSGRQVVTGGHPATEFTVLSTFADGV